MSASTRSTACWSWDARSPSASPDPGRGRGRCARDPDPCNTVAPGRSVPDDQGNEALALAGRRPGWLRARRPRPEAAGQKGRQATAPQAAEKAVPGPSCHDHGQAGELQRRQGRGDALGRTSEAQRIEQPGREFSSADPTTRTTDEAVATLLPTLSMTI